jgi:hypothetical protein
MAIVQTGLGGGGIAQVLLRTVTQQPGTTGGGLGHDSAQYVILLTVWARKVVLHSRRNHHKYLYRLKREQDSHN